MPGLKTSRHWCEKVSTRSAATSDKVYQLLARGRWFSPGTPASSTTKTGRHDIAEILLKVALRHNKSKSDQSKKNNVDIDFSLWFSLVFLLIV
jgi:hypothetical protein